MNPCTLSSCSLSVIDLRVFPCRHHAHVADHQRRDEGSPGLHRLPPALRKPGSSRRQVVVST